MHRFKLLIFGFFLFAACKNDNAKKNDGSKGFPPAGPSNTEETSGVNPSKQDDEKNTPKENEVNTGPVRFSIEAPQGWTKSDTFLMGNNITFLRSPEEENDDFIENINVIKENVGNASLQEYYDKSLSMIKKGLAGFVEGESSDKTINGIQFKNLKYTHNYNGMRLDVDLYLAIHNKVGFVITCTARKGKLSQYQPAFDQALKTFSFQ